MMAVGTKRVLVADDDESVRRALKRLFMTLGCVVDEGYNFHSVKELLEHNDYDLIVCDNAMPIGTEERTWPNIGLELMADAHLSERHYATPFVLHTGDDTDKTKKDVKELGGHYLYKNAAHSRDFFVPLLSAKQTAAP